MMKYVRESICDSTLTFNILGRPRLEYVIKINFITFQTVDQEIGLILIWLYKGMGRDFAYEYFRKIVLILFSTG